jgi:glutamate---cysteine ligase / carboxylate-amine ligase
LIASPPIAAQSWRRPAVLGPWGELRLAIFGPAAEAARPQHRHHRLMLAFRPRTRLAPAPEEAQWRASAQAWAVGLREQAMVVEPLRWELVDDVTAIVATLPPSLRRVVSASANGAALELHTGLHATVPAAVAELGALRGRLTAALGRCDLRAAAAGAHPGGAPTFGLHVAVAVPDFGRATLAHDRMRGHLPLLLALSANSPFLAGCETGLASARGDALEDPSADAQLRTDHGCLEVGVLDAQTRLRDAGALAALIQCLTRLEATRKPGRDVARVRLETVVAGRSRAAARGMAATLQDPRDGMDRPARDLVAALIDQCTEHAVALNCLPDLERVRLLAARPGDVQQRARARLRPGEPAGGRRLRMLTSELSAAYLDT